MNTLPLEKRVQIIKLLVEGMSMRAISRVADISINTVTKVLCETGAACAAYHDTNVRGVNAKRIECDEIWSFCYAKQKNVGRATAAPEGAGDAWTWTAIDADSKLMISYLVGGRDVEYAIEFMQDVKDRITGTTVQLTTDGLKAYLVAVDKAFRWNVNYVRILETVTGDSGVVTGHSGQAHKSVTIHHNHWSRSPRIPRHHGEELSEIWRQASKGSLLIKKKSMALNLASPVNLRKAKQLWRNQCCL